MRNFFKDFEDQMAAAAMAQEGDHRTAKEILEESPSYRERAEAVNVKKERLAAFLEKHDRTEEAIAFAQAGEADLARKVLDEAQRERKKILVAGTEEGFSEKLVQYALGMAARMDYEIIALNVIPVGRQLFSFLHEKEVAEELERRPKDRVRTFEQAAVDRKIPFRHMVKFGGFDRVIRDLHREVPRIAFVLTEPDRLCEETADSRTTGIPVFCMAPEAE